VFPSEIKKLREEESICPEYSTPRFGVKPCWRYMGAEGLADTYRISTAKVFGHREWVTGYLKSGHIAYASIEAGHAQYAHAVVLLECDDDHITMYDPEKGVIKYPWEKYMERLEGKTHSRVCAWFWNFSTNNQKGDEQ
jgi:hypothetical protein